MLMAQRVILLSDRPASVKAVLTNGRPYPRHRDDPHLIELRHRALKLLGFEMAW
jgi:NitT/TauT family transport system ATP-binding protein